MPPTPSAEILAVAYGAPRPRARLCRAEIGHCFSVWIDPAFSKTAAPKAERSEYDLVLAAMKAVQAMTESSVGFEVGARVVDDLRIVKDGSRPYNNGSYVGLTYPRIESGFCRGGEVVLAPDWVRGKPIMHELCHIIGMCDADKDCVPGAAGSVMSAMPHDSLEPSDLDRAAWAWMRMQSVGKLHPTALLSTLTRDPVGVQPIVCSVEAFG